MDGSGPPHGVPRVPLSGDDARSGSADTNSSTTYRPAWSGSGGGVTPELVLVDPELALAQRLTKHRKAAMSSTEPANAFPDPAQPAPTPAQETAQPSMRDVPLGTLIFRAGLLGEEQLVIAVGDPSNELVLEGLRRELETEFQLVVAPHGQLRHVIDEAYAHPAAEPHAEDVLFPELLPQAQDESPAEAEREEEPVLELTPAVELESESPAETAPELEAEPEPESEPTPTTQPFAGSTPALL